MAFSFASYTGDGSTEFAITFNYLAETVVVSTDPKGIEIHLDGVKQTGGYTIDTSLNKVNFTTGPAAGVDIKILRVTPRGKADRLVDWADATIFTEAQLDSMALQLLYIAQEAFEQSSAGGSATPTYLSFNETGDYWDATFGALPKTIRNIADATTNDGVISKKYVDDVAVWGISGVPQSWTFTGNGAQDTFSLTGAPYVEAEMLVVAVDGILQVPTADFTVEGAAVNSTLDFVVAPGTSGDPVDISVQNFGKMRFLDGIDISDGSVTTAKLDQTDGTEAVSTATMRDDAVTAAKIANSVVDLARVNTTTFTTSTSDTTPRFLSVPINGTGLSLGTLSAAQVSDFNSTVTATKLNAFAAPDGNVNMNSKRLTNLADPTASHHATPRDWVQNEIATTGPTSGRDKLGTYSLGAESDTFPIEGWFDDTKYVSYEFECHNFMNDSASSGACIGMLFADVNGTYQTGSGHYGLQYRVWGHADPTYDHGEGWSSGIRMGCAVPMVNDTTAVYYRTDFKLWLPNNRTAASGNSVVVSKGSAALYGESTYRPGHGSTTAYAIFCSFNMHNAFLYGTAHPITKIKFVATNNLSDTAPFTSNIEAGARVIVYGRTF